MQTTHQITHIILLSQRVYQINCFLDFRCYRTYVGTVCTVHTSNLRKFILYVHTFVRTVRKLALVLDDDDDDDDDDSNMSILRFI